MVLGLPTEKDLEDERRRRASVLSLLSLIICCVMYSDSESLAVLYVVLCIQTQKAWLYYMLCCIFGLRKPGCIIFCVMHSDSESLTVLHVVLCIQTQKICLYFYVVLCIRTQKAWPETLPDCLIVLCLRPSGTSTAASVVYVATPGLNPRHVTTRLVAFMAKASSHAPTHLDR